MDDEDVVFEGSPLHEHLIDTGCGDFDCEKKPAHNINSPNRNDNITSANNSEKIGKWQELKRSFHNYVYDESWHKQVKSLHKRSCGHITSTSIKKQILYEEDATYVESFASSLEDGTLQMSSTFSDSLYGQMFLQIAVLTVTIGYGFLRMFYAKSGPFDPPMTDHPGPGTSSSDRHRQPQQQQHEGLRWCSALVYGLDLLSLVVIVAALLPATVKFSSIGRLVGRLEKFTGSFEGFALRAENARRATVRAILFVQESEVVKRGYTLVTVPVSRLELGLNSCGQRECLDLRMSVYHRNRNILMALREASVEILKLCRTFPDVVELKGVKQCLAKRPLKDFCDHLEMPPMKVKDLEEKKGKEEKEDDDELFKMTEGYSLATLKFLMELTGAHASELVRLVSLLSLIRTNELSCDSGSIQNHTFGFSDQTAILNSLEREIEKNLSPLERCLSMAQAMRNKLVEGDEAKQNRKGRHVGERVHSSTGKTALRDIHVAMHSLKLHLESALRRVQQHDIRLESLLDEDDDDDGGEIGTEAEPSEAAGKYRRMVDEMSSEAKQLGRELKAGKECLEELEVIISKLSKAPGVPGGNQPAKDHRCPKEGVKDSEKEAKIILDGTEPIVEDEFFEGVSTKGKELKSLEDDAELEQARSNRKDAARVISELRSVISIRAKDMEERERKAFLKKSNDRPSGGGQIATEVAGGTDGPESPPSNGCLEGHADLASPSTSSEVLLPSLPLGVSGLEMNFNGARPKECVGVSARARKDRQYFRDRMESSDSDEGNVSSGRNLSRSAHLRRRRQTSKPGVAADGGSCGSLSANGQESAGESEEEDGGPFGFGRRMEPDGFDSGQVHNGNFQSTLAIRSLASMAASLSRRVNLGEEEFYGNDEDAGEGEEEEDDDDDLVGRDEDEEGDEEMNDASDSDSQSDLDSDDIYHVTDDDEGFDGVNVGYDEDDDDEEEK